MRPTAKGGLSRNKSRIAAIPGASFDGEADALVREVVDLDSMPPKDTDAGEQYGAAVADAVEVKEAQAERLENRLEALQQAQQASLQVLESSRPGRLSMPSARRKWDAQYQAEQRRMRQIADRLTYVRELKGHIDNTGSSITALAVAKVRRDSPGLAGEWDAEQAAQRRQEAERREVRKAEAAQQRQGVGNRLRLAREA